MREVGITPLAALPAILAIRAQLAIRRTPPGRLATRSTSLPMRSFWQAADKAFAH